MRNTEFTADARHPNCHGFGAREQTGIANPLQSLRRRFDHWRRQASDDAIVSQLSDVHFNPFVFLIESGR
jgi:hypothetical protein